MVGKYDRDSRDGSGGVKGGVNGGPQGKPPWDKAHGSVQSPRIYGGLINLIESGQVLTNRQVLNLSIKLCDFIQKHPDERISSSPIDPALLFVKSSYDRMDWTISLSHNAIAGLSASQNATAGETQVHSMGRLMYQLITGEPLPQASDSDSAKEAIVFSEGGAMVHNDFKKMSDSVGENFAWIVAKALDDPKRSFESIGHIRAALWIYMRYGENGLSAYRSTLRKALLEKSAQPQPAPASAPCLVIPDSIREMEERYESSREKGRAAKIIAAIAIVGGLAAGTAYFYDDLKQLANKYLFGEKEAAGEVQPPAPAPLPEKEEAHMILLKISPKGALVQSVYFHWGKKKFSEIGTAKDGTLEVKLYHEKMTIRVKKEGYHSEEATLTRAMDTREIKLSKKKRAENPKEEANADSEVNPQDEPQEEAPRADTEADPQPSEGEAQPVNPEAEQPSEDGKGREEEAPAPNTF